MIHNDEIKHLLHEHAQQISLMSEEQKSRLTHLLNNHEKKKRQYHQLESMLEQDLNVHELNQTHTNLANLAADIADLEKQLKNSFSNGQSDPNLSEATQKARAYTRQGFVPIRPVKGRAYSQAPERKKKNYTSTSYNSSSN